MRSLIIAVCLLLCTPAMMLAAELHGFFEYGYETEFNYWTTDLEIRFEFDFLFEHTIYGGQTVLFEREGMNGFPFTDIYTVGYKATFKMFYFRFDHGCAHRVISPPVRAKAEGKQPVIPTLHDHTTFSIGIEW